jgi:aldose 1-epimerase
MQLSRILKSEIWVPLLRSPKREYSRGSVCIFISLIAFTMSAATIQKSDFGKTSDGAAVALYTLKNSKGMEARIITYGGAIVSLKTPDRTGAMGDVVLGYDNLAGYTGGKAFFGALVGRYANRIAKGQFAIDGATYNVPKNDGENALHGGLRGFDKRVWTAREMPGGALQLTYVSKDGEEGYPGTLTATVTYTLTDENTLRIHYAAVTDKPTVLNLTNHSYFNLKGDGDILGHMVTLNADKFTPVDAGLIPTGELRLVEGTPFDFRHPRTPGERIGQADQQLKLGKGYDHNWILNRTGVANGALSLAARVAEPGVSGRVMEIYTDQPGVQFYTGNFLDGTEKGKGGKVYNVHAGFCFETQHYPDSPNKAAFPSAVLRPGQKYDTTTEFRFSAK